MTHNVVSLEEQEYLVRDREIFRSKDYPQDIMEEATAMVERILGEKDPDRLAIWQGKVVPGFIFGERSGIRQSIYTAEGLIADLLEDRKHNAVPTPEQIEYFACRYLCVTPPDMTEEELIIRPAAPVLPFSNRS